MYVRHVTSDVEIKIETVIYPCQRGILLAFVVSFDHNSSPVALRVPSDVSGESSQSGGQFQGRPSEVWSQWQNQHHSQPAGEQHTHTNPSQTEVFQVACSASTRIHKRLRLESNPQLTPKATVAVKVSDCA